MGPDRRETPLSAPLSIVIPTLNAMQEIGPTLGSIAPGLAAGLIRELVISDGGSGDEVAEVAEELGARLVVGPAGRGGQLRRGAEAATGDWLLFLHADTRLPPGWIETIGAHIENRPDQAAVFRLSYIDRSFGASVVAGWANLRTRLFALPYGDQGLLISRRHYEAVGGFPEQPIMEDVAIIRAIGRSRLRLLPMAVETSFIRYSRAGWMRRGLRNWFLLAQYFAGVSPKTLAERYRR